ncbi:MAG: hypothetical protein EOO52_20265 [Gammaproteobacteria bacterium]|nr:MAG: hypothetical protein EOO52_20265 [Gammaproteobacteria bacterium]
MFYSTEILLIALCMKWSISLWFVVLLQCIANALSLYFFYKLVRYLTASTQTAFLFSLFFLAMYYYHLYNVHLFTESLFFSFSILYAYLLFTTVRLSFFRFSLILLGLGLLSITRPTGILLIPPTLFYFIFQFGEKRALALSSVVILAGLAGFYFLLNAALNAGGEFDFLLPYIEEHIICGVPTATKANNIQMAVNKNSVEGLWAIIANNGDLFSRLAKQRFLAFWGVQRSFYSTFHNAFLAIYFYPLYLLICLGARKMFLYGTPQAIFITTYILLTTLTVVLSCDEWHNRFLFAILPFLLLMATGLFIKKPNFYEYKNVGH